MQNNVPTPPLAVLLSPNCSWMSRALSADGSTAALAHLKADFSASDSGPVSGDARLAAGREHGAQRAAVKEKSTWEHQVQRGAGLTGLVPWLHPQQGPCTSFCCISKCFADPEAMKNK